MSEPVPKQIIDVERLVEELKERAARERESGAYGDDLSRAQLEVPPAAPVVEGFDLAGGAPRIRFRPELGYSSKPVIGPLITLVKKFFLRLLFYVFDDLAQQADVAVRRLETAIAAEASATEARISAEVTAREGLQRDVVSLLTRITQAEGRLAQTDDRLDRLRLEARLARLERERRREAAPPQGAPAEIAPAAAPSFDYETFESRFRPEQSVRERQQAYVEALRGRSRVVDLGCGRGELVAMLNEAGISAYGVEIDPDFVELLQERGVEVVAEDALAHLTKLEPGTVDGIVASHLVEHLPAAVVSQLVSLAAEKLADEGLLIIETPNPESLVAGSVNFHRDLTHVRPIHPDTLAFLCESAGFSDVEIRRLSPVPDDERLPTPSAEPLAEIVGRLNELLYGYQDYAVVARKR